MAKKQPKPKGSTRKGQEKGPNLSTHPLVAKFLDELPPRGESVALVGYLGPSAKKDHRLLYLDLNFRTFYEIYKEDIVDTCQIDPKNEYSPTLVIIKPTAKRVLSKLPYPGSETEFLKGDITKGLSDKAKPSSPEHGPLVGPKDLQADTGCEPPASDFAGTASRELAIEETLEADEDICQGASD